MAAQNGTITFQRPSGTKFTYSFYLDDSAGNAVRWLKDGKAGSASPDNQIVTEPCVIKDFCIAAASGQTTTVIKINDQPVSVLLNAAHLATIYYRPEPNIFLAPGQKLTAVQLA